MLSVRCIDNRAFLSFDGEDRLVFGRFDWPTDLTSGRLYEVLSEEHGMYRVVDDTGEDYMYPIWMFGQAFQQSLSQ